MEVEEILEQAKQTFKDKGKEYGHTYENFANVISALFPDGIYIIPGEENKTNKIGIIFMIVHKIMRYCNSMPDGHNDSLKDIIVYAAMMEEIDTKNDNNNGLGGLRDSL